MQSYKGLQGFSMISGDTLDGEMKLYKDSEESSANLELLYRAMG